MQEKMKVRDSHRKDASPVVVVTGSAQGIGREIVRLFAERGARVVVSDIDEAACERTATDLHLDADRSAALACDVREAGACARLAELTEERFGALDVWVNNAGVIRDALLLRMKPEDFEHVFDVNVRGTFYGMQAAARRMIRARRGKIVNIGSISGLYGNAGQTNYSASKAAVHSMTRSAARELAPRNVQVNCLAVGPIANGFNAHVPTEIMQGLLSQIPLGDHPDPELQVARAVHFLASAEADYITGVVLRVDGGMAIGL